MRMPLSPEAPSRQRGGEPPDGGPVGPALLLRRLSGVAGAGLAGWLVDIALLWFTHDMLGAPAVAAAAIGFLAAGAVNFLLNQIVFAGDRARTRSQAWRYAVLFGVNLPVVALSVPLVAAVVDALAPDVPASLLVAKVLVTALLLPLNAWAYGAWVFRTTHPGRDSGPGGE
jgi:putative flippase GtrA